MTENQPTTVGDDMPKQQARVRQIQQRAIELGRMPGVNTAFLVAMTERALRDADEAVMSGDVVRILRAYQELLDFKE